MRYHLTPIRMVMYFFFFWRCGKIGALVHRWYEPECEMMQSLWKTARWLFRKLNKLNMCSSDPMPRDTPKRTENRSSEDAYMWLSAAAASFAMTAMGTSVHYRCGYTPSTCTERSIPRAHAQSGVYTGHVHQAMGSWPCKGRRLEDRPSETTQTQEDCPAWAHLHKPCSRQRHRDWKHKLAARGRVQGAGSRCFKVT